jgi:hypothetical protein
MGFQNEEEKIIVQDKKIDTRIERMIRINTDSKLLQILYS